MIEFDNAGFSYGNHIVLRELNLTLALGDFHFLNGVSGSGKSTLLQLCYMDLAPTSGAIRYFGKSISRDNRDAVSDLRRSVGVIHQNSLFFDHLSVVENVAFPLHVCGMSLDSRSEDILALLEWVGLTDRSSARPTDLSGEERQRAALARAVILSPEIILADEPTGNLDSEAAVRLVSLLVELNQMGKTVLLASHDKNLVRTIESRARTRMLRLEQGKIQTVGTNQ